VLTGRVQQQRIRRRAIPKAVHQEPPQPIHVAGLARVQQHGAALDPGGDRVGGPWPSTTRSDGSSRLAPRPWCASPSPNSRP
jgi:hypothetical protein